MLNNVTLGQLETSIHKAVPELSEALVKRFAAKILAETDERLETNVREWLDEVPLTGIVIGDFSVPLIMQIRGNNDFFGALTAMNDYIKEPVLGARKIWRTIR